MLDHNQENQGLFGESDAKQARANNLPALALIAFSKLDASNSVSTNSDVFHTMLRLPKK
jgi:hypothetical protein